METQIKVGVLIIDSEKLLLIKEWSNNKNGYFWNIIKGTFDNTLDKTILDCAKREVKEEVGTSIKLNNLINISFKHGFNTRIYLNFTASITKGKPHFAPKKEQDSRQEEIIETKWFTKNELKKLSEVDFINDVVYKSVKDWLKGNIYSLDILSEKNLNS